MRISAEKVIGEMVHAQPETDLGSWCLAGKYWEDISEGMQVWNWRASAVGSGIHIDVPGEVDGRVMVAENSDILKVSLAFDQWMLPVVCYETALAGKLLFTEGGIEYLIDYGGKGGEVLLLDKRNRPADVVCVYVSEGKLYVRKRSESYSIVTLLADDRAYLKVLQLGSTNMGRLQIRTEC